LIKVNGWYFGGGTKQIDIEGNVGLEELIKKLLLFLSAFSSTLVP